MRLAARVPILVASLVATTACDDGPANAPTDAGLEQFQLPAEPDPGLNATTQILNGPFLSAPGEGTMTVSWHTEVPSSSVVRFGLQGEAQQEVTGIVFEQLPTSPEPILWGVSPKGYMHEVTLTGLTPGATYTYQVLSVASPVGGTFTAPPAPGDSFSFVVFGDSRTGHENHQRVIDGIVDYADAHRWPVFLIVINANYSLMGLFVAVPFVWWLTRTGYAHGRYILWAVVSFAAAVFCRVADPWALLPVGTHFLWHTFGALTAHLMIAFLFHIRADAIQPSPRRDDATA